jgi:hypothetical protein
MLRITSANSDAAIEFSELQGDYFRVAIIAHNHSASRRVYAYTDASGIAGLFADAAREWRGWEGSKMWCTIEGELQLDLTSDRRGHVMLHIRLSSDAGGVDAWQHDANLGIEAGQLDGIAKSARSFFGDGG